MEIGSVAIFVGLKKDPGLNGEFVEILTPLVENEVVESDGVPVKALRYGVEHIRTGKTGYVRPENLSPEPGDVRSVCLHLFGEEQRPQS